VVEMVQNKNGNYAIYLWISAALLIVVGIIIPDYLDSTTEFVLLFIDFFGFLAILFAVFYSYLAIETMVKEKKKKKRIVNKDQ
jgi:predicted membrane protein